MHTIAKTHDGNQDTRGGKQRHDGNRNGNESENQQPRDRNTKHHETEQKQTAKCQIGAKIAVAPAAPSTFTGETKTQRK
jgi:hypothetical protein